MKKAAPSGVRPAACAQTTLCPLSKLRAGDMARIKRLGASPDMVRRLRELGLYEDQHIRVLSHNFSLICQVCNARLGLSTKLGDTILVERLERPRKAKAA